MKPVSTLHSLREAAHLFSNDSGDGAFVFKDRGAVSVLWKPGFLRQICRLAVPGHFPSDLTGFK